MQPGRFRETGWRGVAGFTLIELMVAVVIIAILIGVALPSYRNSVIKGNRAEAKAALVTIATRQEQVRSNNRVYTTNIADVWSIPDNQDCDGNPGTTTLTNMTENCLYDLSLTGGALVFTVFAVPNAPQDKDDCGTLSLDSRGRKTSGGGNELCW